MQALDPSEVRTGLSEASDYQIQGIVEDDSPINVPEQAMDIPVNQNPDGIKEENPRSEAEQKA